MSQGNELFPAQDAAVEEEWVGFDFGPILAAGETILSITSVTCAVVTGTDDAPSSRLIGGAMIVSSSSSGTANAQVNQLFGGSVAGVTYRLQCVVATSGDQALSLWTHIAAVAPL